MDLSDVKTVGEELIEDIVFQIERDSLLAGYDFSKKLRGIRDVGFLFKLLNIRDNQEDPFPLIESELKKIEESAHSYLKYELILEGTSRSIWENDLCEIMYEDGRIEKAKIEILCFDNQNKVNKLSYATVENPSCNKSIGGTSHLFKLPGEKQEKWPKKDPVSKLKFRPAGETKFFNFKWLRSHLVSQNYLIERTRSVRLRKNGNEYLFKYDCYLSDSQKLLFTEGHDLRAITLKDFDGYEILEVI